MHPPLRLAAICALLGLLGACASRPQRAGTVPPPILPPTPASAEAANAVLFRAMGLVGTPYRFGGNTPEGGFDCSGLVAYVFADSASLRLPRTSTEMSALGRRRLAPVELRSGDLVFFAARTNISHVGIYVGEQRFVHAPNEGGTVRLDRLDAGWWRDHFAYGKRVLE